MAKFAKSSRYAKHASVFKTTDPRGREVLAVTPPLITPKHNRGTHIAKTPNVWIILPITIWVRLMPFGPSHITMRGFYPMPFWHKPAFAFH